MKSRMAVTTFVSARKLRGKQVFFKRITNMTLSTSAVLLVTSESLGFNTTYQQQEISVGKLVFEVAVILIGIVGALGNGTVLCIFCALKQLRKQDVNVLFINQLSLDLFCCFWLVVEYPFKMANIYLKGPTGNWLCALILSENISYYGIFGSKLNLMSIAIERYVKIVHPIWHKKNFKSWMIHSAAAVPWVAGVFLNQLMTSWSTTVVDGQCLWGFVWINDSGKYGLPISTFVITFCFPFASFLFCYSSIIYVVRRQAKVVASQRAVNPLAETANNRHDNLLQMNAVKTMIVISVAFVVCWLPNDLYVVITLFYADTSMAMRPVYYATVLAGFLNVCMNPFIYALKYDAVRNRLFNFMGLLCNKGKQENSTTINVINIDAAQLKEH